jgi:hypothetical protein
VQIVEGDMSRPSSLESALDGVDRVLMISAPIMDMVETQNTFIDAAKVAGVRHVIKFSGLDARRDTTFPYGFQAVKPSYLMWLEWKDGRINFIRDYKYVRYVIDDAELVLAPDAPPPARRQPTDERAAASPFSSGPRDGAFWHKADIPTRSINVCFWGKADIDQHDVDWSKSGIALTRSIYLGLYRANFYVEMICGFHRAERTIERDGGAIL